MTEAAIKPGETVRLKSGGPLMTVKTLDGSYAICDWFEGKNKKEDRFLIVTLKLDDDMPGSISLKRS